MRRLEIGIDRHRLDFGPSDFVVAGVVANLDVIDYAMRPAELGVLLVAIEEAQIVIVGRDWTEYVVPHQLVGDERIVRIEQGERLPRNVADQAAMVIAEPDLCGIFLGRFLVRRRPINALRGHDVHPHAHRRAVVDTGRHEILHQIRVFGGDDLARLDLRVNGRGVEE
jgi:hypothetical protein